MEKGSTKVCGGKSEINYKVLSTLSVAYTVRVENKCRSSFCFCFCSNCIQTTINSELHIHRNRKAHGTTTTAATFIFHRKQHGFCIFYFVFFAHFVYAPPKYFCCIISRTMHINYFPISIFSIIFTYTFARYESISISDTQNKFIFRRKAIVVSLNLQCPQQLYLTPI